MTERRFRLFKASTRAFAREGRKVPGFSLFDLLHGFLYGARPYFYIGTALGTNRLTQPLVKFADWLIQRRDSARQKAASSDNADAGSDVQSGTIADTYHGKVVPLDAAERLVQVNVDVTLPDLEPVIPFAVARDIVLQHPDHIVVLDCPCRMSRENPCLPLDVCLIVGEPFASFIMEHQPEHARWITPDEAVEILRAEDERGHVHHAFFKDAMLGRFYAICNCCSCCCGAMQAQRNGVPMLISSGYVSVVDDTRCAGCGTCVSICPFGAISLQDGVAVVDTATCMGCGVCVHQCPQDALSLLRDAARPEPLEIHKLMAEVV